VFDKKGLRFITAGTMSVKFWNSQYGGRGGQDVQDELLIGVHGSVGEEGTSQCAVCIEFVTKNTAVTGMQDGSIYVWNGTSVARSVELAHTGPVMDMVASDKFLYTAGKDGKLHKWALSARKQADDDPKAQRTITQLVASVDADEVCRSTDSAYEAKTASSFRASSPTPGRASATGSRGSGSRPQSPLRGRAEANSPAGARSRSRGRAHGSTSRSRSHGGTRTRGSSCSSSGALLFWDLHSPCIRSIALRPQFEAEDDDDDDGTLADVLVFGLESNSIHLLSQTNEDGAASCQTECVVFSHAMGPLIGVAAHPTKHLFTSLGSDGAICLWDTQTRRLVSQHRLWVPKPIWGGGHAGMVDENEPRGAALDISGEKEARVAVGMSDGSIRVLGVDYTGMTVLKGHHSREAPVCAVRFSRKAEMVAVAYADNLLQIFARDPAAPPVKQDWEFQSHRSISITGSGTLDFLDWTEDMHFLQGASSSSEQIYFDVSKGRQVRKASDMRDIEFVSHTCPIGWALIGLVSASSTLDPSTQVTAADRVSSTIIAAGRRNGEILLSQLPSLQRAAIASYPAHTGAVIGLRVVQPLGGIKSAGTPRVVSAGSEDRMILQWRVRAPVAKKRVIETKEALPADMQLLILPRSQQGTEKEKLLNTTTLLQEALGQPQQGSYEDKHEYQRALEADDEVKQDERHWTVRKPEPLGGVSPDSMLHVHSVSHIDVPTEL